MHGTETNTERDTHTQNILKGLGVIQKAGGGGVESGQVFVARENGMPEMVGRFGNTTAVANNEQITQGIAQGVAQAVAPMTHILESIRLAIGDANIDGEKLAKILAPAMDYQLGVLKG